MRMNPKRIGDELTLDEYNACQYLLYNMDCWKENIKLDTYSKYKGKYATYLLKESNTLRTDKQDTYRVNTTLTNTNSTFTIQLSEINSNIDRLTISPKMKMYVRFPQKYKDGDGAEKNYDPTDYLDIPQWSIDEAKARPKLEDYFELIEVPCTYDKDKKQIIFSLFKNNEAMLVKETLISKKIQITYMFNEEPYIDFRNGKANNVDEILVDNPQELEKLIKNTPPNELTVFRLDSNIELPKPPKTKNSEILGTYYLSEPIIIQNGQNIEIRGGTNHGVKINASLSKRCFIVKPGGRLSLRNIVCEYGNCFNNFYDTGRGGAILVEQGYNDFGILECVDCGFEHNMGHYGGAIFSYHAGLHLHNCFFRYNSCIGRGGAIFYQAKDAVLDFKNILTKNGATAVIKVTAKTNNGETINEGEVEFYIRKNNVDTLIGKSRVRDGEASINYTVPNETKTIEYPLIAIYKGGRGVDDEIAVATMKIKVPMKYTASWVTGNVYKAKVGTSLKIFAKVVDIEQKVSTEPTMMFRIRGQSIKPVIEGNSYVFNYPITENEEIYSKDDGYKLTLTFAPVASDEYTCNTIVQTITIDKDEEQKEKNTEGYITGLFVNSANVNETLVEAWNNAGITDVYVRLSNYTIVSYRKELEDSLRIIKAKKYNIRVHVAINCLYDVKAKKSFSPTDSSRMDFIKKEIDFISTYDGIAGINLDYARYMGGTSSDREAKITEYFKTITNYIKSKNKSYVVSASIKAEDSASWTDYGQRHSAIAEIIDYIQPMIYKSSYNINDEEVLRKTKFKINQGVAPEKIVVALETYKEDFRTPRSIDDITTTVTKLAQLKVKGVALFREELAPSGYIAKSYTKIMNGGN